MKAAKRDSYYIELVHNDRHFKYSFTVCTFKFVFQASLRREDSFELRTRRERLIEYI